MQFIKPLPQAGNPKLKGMSPLQARKKFRALMIGNPKLRNKYYHWLRDYSEIKAGMDSRFRGL